MGFAVFFEEVLLECLLASAGFHNQAFPPLDVFFNLQTRHISFVAMTKGSMSMGEVIDQLRADCDFHPFNASRTKTRKRRSKQ